jgi:polyvinyl alcohol dehydrogenase (cytochrome)
MRFNVMKSNGRLMGVVALGLVSAGLALSASAAPTTGADWTMWGGSLSNTRDAATETIISPSTAAKLTLKWSYTTEGTASQTPTIEGSYMYVTDEGGYVHKVDTTTGAAVWKQALSTYTGSTKSYSRNSPAIGSSTVVVGDRALGRAALIALNKSTGALAWKTRVDTDPSAVITGSPIIYDGLVYVGVSSQEEGNPQFFGHPNFRGSVVALDEATGKLVWRLYTVPRGYTGGAVWGSTPAIDPARGLLYFTTGNNTHLPDSVATCVNATTDPTAQLACMAPDNYFNSVVAVSMKTGKVKWADRLNNGADSWFFACLWQGSSCQVLDSPDYDFGSGANLITATINGQSTQLVGAGQKSGVYWALNPDTGKVVWSTQVGPGSFSGGIMWGSASDGKQIYVSLANALHESFALDNGTGPVWNGGAWTALDVGTGAMVWQVPELGTTPNDSTQPSVIGTAMTVANGVVFTGTADGYMVALDAASGDVLWKFQTPGTIMCGPSVVNGTVYWGSGWSGFGGSSSATLVNNVVYAFSVQ